MRTLTVELGERRYPIHIGPGLLGRAESYRGLAGRQVRVVTDAHVAPLYLAPLLAALGLDEEAALVLPAGEGAKTFATAERILDWMLAAGLHRDAVLVALGGGVIGDMVGFAAALYQRGIDFVQIPTTLLAQVDSAVGGKTAVNHPRGKNMIGAFHQPSLVLSDLDTLRSLPPRELRAGLAEIIKYGMLGDAAFFAWLEEQLDALLALDAAPLAEAVDRCCQMKARIVALDERERLGGGPRALLNLGHTFGHAVETHTGYTQWLHGEAVGLGLVMAADLSARLGWLAPQDAARCRQLVARAGLPLRPPPDLDAGRFLQLMGHDKKVAAGRLRLVLLRGLGHAELCADFDPAQLRATLQHFTG
jgi:3-dehydroquinate synthase